MNKTKPALFGIQNSNHDFSRKSSWGKNVFNNAFPVSLTCYLYSKNIQPVYITLNEDLTVKHEYITSSELFGIETSDANIHFSFESNFNEFQKVLSHKLPRADVVTSEISGDKKTELRAIEIKLTTLPDNSTCEFGEDRYSTELVVRPDTIVYMACTMALDYQEKRKELEEIMKSVCEDIKDWSNSEEISDKRTLIINVLDEVLRKDLSKQSPLVLQPVWKTQGKSIRLAENCLDVFIWSDYAFSRLFVDPARSNTGNGITRQYRTVVWLVKMLYDFAVSGKINHLKVIDELSYNTKNDKAFADSGIVTYPYLKSPELLKPRIIKNQLKEIILGNGHELLSPERRLDAVIQNTPDLFD